MKKSELKEMIKTAFLSEADFTNAQDDDASASIAADYDPLAEEETMDEAKEESLDDILDSITGTIDEAKGDDEMEDESRAERADVDKYEFEKGKEAGEKEKEGDSIVIDKKIVSLSSLPGETRKILDTLETLRAQAEEFGDQEFITQVGNTITFFTRDFVVAGDAPNPAGIEEAETKKEKEDRMRDAEKDDAAHIRDLEKDMEDDKKEDKKLQTENVAFPMWNKIK